jgi:predicted MFS family arabinose efflux permease
LKAAIPTLWGAFWLALAVAVVNGFARFAYALILPAMRADLGWDYAASGWLNTANSIGYALGGLTGVWLLRSFRAEKLFVVGLISTAVLVGLMGFTSNLAMMMFWRLLAGIGAAWVFSCGGAFAAARYNAHPEKAGAAIAIFYAGGGLGMTFSGMLLYPVLDGAMTWQVAWMVLGAAGLVLALMPVWVAKQAPGNGAQSVSNTSVSELFASLKTARMMPSFVAYILFGVGYIVYLTFVVAWLKELQVAPTGAAALWIALGLAASVSGWVWKGVMGRWWPSRTFALASICIMVGSVIPVMVSGTAGLAVSVLLVGGSFYMVPAAVVALIRKKLPQAQWATMMNLYTMVFALGQAVGPVLAGALADVMGLNWAMVAAAVVMLLSAALVLLDKPVPEA